MGRPDSERNSESDAALVRVQMDAKARNRRWRAYLCARRDELQARLGYAHVLAHNSATDLHGFSKQMHAEHLSAEQPSSRSSGAEIASALAPASAPGVDIVDSAEASDQPGDPPFAEQDMDEPESSATMYNNDFPDALATSSSAMGTPRLTTPANKSRR